MQVKDYPVVILAAGKGKRLGDQFGGLNKTLLPLFDEHTILDLLLFKIISQGVSQVKIIAGYKSGNLLSYIKSLKENFKNKQFLASISQLFLSCDIAFYKARMDYIKGPLYTLLTLNQLPPMNSHDQLKTEETYFTVIPSDTIFSGGILKQILSLKIQKEGLEAQNSELEQCHLFVINLTQKSAKMLVKHQNFSFTSIKISDDNTIKFEKYTKQKPNSEQDYLILLPLTFVSSGFLKYSESILGRGVNKLMDAVEKFLEDGNKIRIHKLNFTFEGTAPFLDVDDISTYDRVLELGKKFTF
jgi:hypothetical protein